MELEEIVTLELTPTMLTTVDNPYNPREDYEKWLNWDHNEGYYTQEYLARVACLDIEDEGPETDIIMELAKLSIIENDMTNLYVLV